MSVTTAPRARRKMLGRVGLLVAGLLLAGAGAALAYFVISVVDNVGNNAFAQATELSAPTNATSAEASATSVTVSWTNPAIQVPGAQYQVTASPGGVVCTTTSTSCLDSGLTPGGAYSFSIIAVVGSNWQSSAITTSYTALAVTTTSLPGGTVGAAYSSTLAATGGSGTYTHWALSSGTLPSWATLNSSSGVISGTPTTAATTSGLVFTVTDSDGFTASSGSLSLAMAKDGTTTTVSELPTTVAFGNESSVTFTAHVSSTHGETVPNGEVITVSVNSGATTCTVTLPATTCTIGNSALPGGGPYPVTASYPGDGNLLSSTGTAPTGLTVNATPPSASAPGVSGTVHFGTNPYWVNRENVTLTDTPSTNGGSAIASVTYYYCLTSQGSCTNSSTANWTLIGTSTTTGTWSLTWASGSLPVDGPYYLMATATNTSSLTSGLSSSTEVGIDTTAPNVSQPTVNGIS